MTNYFLHKAKVLSGIQLNTLKYNVFSIKLETKVLRLHRIKNQRVKNMSLFLVNTYGVYNF